MIWLCYWKWSVCLAVGGHFFMAGVHRWFAYSGQRRTHRPVFAFHQIYPLCHNSARSGGMGLVGSDQPSLDGFTIYRDLPVSFWGCGRCLVEWHDLVWMPVYLDCYQLLSVYLLCVGVSPACFPSGLPSGSCLAAGGPWACLERQFRVFWEPKLG